jgi:hypothetical protein
MRPGSSAWRIILVIALLAGLLWVLRFMGGSMLGAVMRGTTGG